MSTATAEIVNREGAVAYLEGLSGNITHTCSVEIDILLAGLAAAGLEDTEVTGGIEGARDAMTAALGGIAAALGRLKGAHAQVSEVMAAAGQETVAAQTNFYEAR